MKLLTKIFFTTFITIILLIVIWIIGAFADFPVVPSLKTYYLINGKNISNSNVYILKKIDNTIIKLEIPNEFFDNNKCFDIWFISIKGKHNITVKDFSQTLFDNDKIEINKKKSYLFSNNGSKSETYKIDNYEINDSDKFNKKNYIFFRTVFDIVNKNEFELKIKVYFNIDNKSNKIDKILSIEKKERVTWSHFRLH